jgi:hypothetical protein
LTRGAPSRSTTWEPAAAGNWRRSIAAANPVHRRQVLHPLRVSPSPSSSSLDAGVLRPSPSRR